MKRKSKPATPAAERETKAGWRISEWSRSIGISRPGYYCLQIRPRCVHLGSAVVIIESPEQYLERVAAEQARDAVPA